MDLGKIGRWISNPMDALADAFRSGRLIRPDAEALSLLDLARAITRVSSMRGIENQHISRSLHNALVMRNKGFLCWSTGLA